MKLYFGLTLVAAWGSVSLSASSSIHWSVATDIANDTFTDMNLAQIDLLHASASWPYISSNNTANRRLTNDALRSFGVYWIHTPKSGSSFGLAILQACDPPTFTAMRNRPTNPKLDSVTSNHFSGFCNDWLTKLVIGEVPPSFMAACHNVQTGIGHFHFPPHLDAHKAVMLLRQPKSRAVSSFLDWPSHHEGMEAPLWDKLVKDLVAASPICGKPRDKHPRTGKTKPWSSCTATAQVYLSHTGLQGCVVKTLLGLNCYSSAKSPPLTMAATEKAAERLKQFRFVGLLSDWEATLKDYLWLNFPPSLAASYNWDAPLDSMLTAVHRSGDHALAQQIAEEVKYDDPFDGHLYRVGEELAKSFRALRLERQGAGRDHWSCRSTSGGSGGRGGGGGNNGGGHGGKSHETSAPSHHDLSTPPLPSSSGAPHSRGDSNSISAESGNSAGLSETGGENNPPANKRLNDPKGNNKGVRQSHEKWQAHQKQTHHQPKGE